ncbi:glycosyltransferase family 4 protein [Enterovibrio sp. ZSDZ35]|uniref:Glycosyltransferase family 4 protein n=1 Tax=Enterovibrio qingdaonensis TaxID=2899818 RepID=A0ABT5QPF7_9GAMM|nr:glycosyltransferase family 4 protein [Enterovibrio sp. ZSDZ35]MDD1782176.1 glycosyltransferase family 4 protein [Enterovibrio sp. ZSDZ35]
MKTVLHITEAFGGGIQTALCSYVRSTAEDPIRHLLFARKRKQDDIDLAFEELFSEVQTVDGSLLTFFKNARKAVLQTQPDIIHLHSSFAGFLGRYLPKGNAKIVYTPHCYAFERRDISPSIQRIYMTLETLGLSRIDLVAGCSKRECELALELGAKKAIHLNNYAEIDSISFTSGTAPKPNTHGPFNVVVVGRISPQKDPAFLLDTLINLQLYPEGRHVTLHWLGGGPPEMEKPLLDAGIKVSGMIPHTQLMQRLNDADLYLHTAAWEGMPLTLLEAAKLNVPMVLRIIGATQNLHYPFMVSTPEAMAKQIVNFCRRPDHPDYQQSLEAINATFSAEKQRAALNTIYGN